LKKKKGNPGPPKKYPGPRGQNFKSGNNPPKREKDEIKERPPAPGSTRF